MQGWVDWERIAMGVCLSRPVFSLVDSLFYGTISGGAWVDGCKEDEWVGCTTSTSLS